MPKSSSSPGPSPSLAARLLPVLEKTYPDARCALDYQNPLELLVATILSAQCTDARVNRVTPALFRRYPDAAAYARAVPEELETLIHSCGFYRQKARAIRGCCARIAEEFGGEVPDRMDDLVTLPGVGRKTANVVLNEAYGQPAIAVDTHVLRTGGRLGWIATKDPVKAEFQLMEAVPEKWWGRVTQLLIHHGRNLCPARKPRCADCPLLPGCPHGQSVVSA